MDLKHSATNTVTDTGASEAQATERVYTQKEFDDAMAKTRTAVERKITKQYADLGDPEELRALKSQVENTRVEEHKSKGDWESILRDMAQKKDAEIAKRDNIIAQYRVETPLMETAAKYRAVAPEQVKSLLRNQIKLTTDGEVEVVDANGMTRYKDNGEAWGVEDLVKNFLDSNPHFVAAGPTTTQTKAGNNVTDATRVDISKLDMSRASDREVYKKWKSQQSR